MLKLKSVIFEKLKVSDKGSTLSIYPPSSSYQNSRYSFESKINDFHTISMTGGGWYKLSYVISLFMAFLSIDIRYSSRYKIWVPDKKMPPEKWWTE